MLASLAFLALSQTAWKPYTLGGFGIQLPSPPVDASLPSVKDTRSWRSMHNKLNAIVFGISTINDPKALENPDQILAASVAGTSASDPGELVSEKDILVDGWPGVDYLIHSDTGIFYNVRSMIIGDKMVQILVTGFSEAAVKPPLTRATASFTLGSTAKGPQTVAGPSFLRQTLGASGAVIDLPRPPKEESAPFNDKVPMILHRFSSFYENRDYLVVYADIPDAASAKEGDFDQLIQGANDSLVDTVHGTPTPSTDIVLDGSPGIRTIAKIGDAGLIRIETTIYKDRLYSLVSVAPACCKDSAEIKRFFASFHFTAPKGG